MKAASSALSAIGEDGCSVEVTTDFESIPSIASGMGKPHLTPLLTPLNHDFTSQNAFWLILRDTDNSPLGCIGARLEEVGEGEIAEYWHRVFTRHYPDAGPVQVNLAGSARAALAGRLAYIGDLYMVPPSESGLGQSARGRVSSLLLLTHALVALEWKVDAAYSFITRRDGLRGAGLQYGYTVQLPMQKGWNGRPPKNRYDDEWLIILPASDRDAVFRRPA